MSVWIIYNIYQFVIQVDVAKIFLAKDKESLLKNSSAGCNCDQSWWRRFAPGVTKMEWKESFSEDGKCWWLATDCAPCVAQVRKSNGTYAVEFFDALGEGYSQSTGFRNLAQAKHVAARRFREAVNRSEAWRMRPPLDAMIEPDFIYIP